MIVRNEADNIQRSLGSLRKVVDRIVLVDTGSSDDTVNLAEKAGAEVSYFPWVDDFSAARNAALDRATGDWILWIDADEALSPHSIGEVKEAVRNPSSLGYLVVRHDLLTDAPDAAYTQMWQLRLFRNRPDLRFRGRCHPDFDPSLFEVAEHDGLEVRESGIVLKHWGYTKDRKPAKLTRARKLLEAELQDRPGQLYYEVEYIRTLMAMGERSAAANTLKSLMLRIGNQLSEPVAPHPSMALLLEIILQLPDAALTAPWSSDNAAAAAARWFPKAPPLIWLRAQAAFSRHDYATAAELLSTLVQMGHSGDYDRQCSFDPRIIHQDAEINLGVCLVHLGERKTAKRYFRRLSKTGGASAKAARENLRLLSKGP
jgi:hypothetical protein